MKVKVSFGKIEAYNVNLSDVAVEVEIEPNELFEIQDMFEDMFGEVCDKSRQDKIAREFNEALAKARGQRDNCSCGCDCDGGENKTKINLKKKPVAYGASKAGRHL